MSYKTFIFFILSTLLLGACTSDTDKRLEYALTFAGKNRIELEKVLTHYQNDPQKLKAARFLIENMPRYFSYQGWELDTLKKMKAETVILKRIPPEEVKKWSSFSPQQLKRVYDAHVITADYLIKNIDMAFQTWYNKPWSKYYTFDDFCELILPYRIEFEPLESWREDFYTHYNSILDSLYKGSDVVEATGILGDYMLQEKYVYNTELHLPALGGKFLLKNRVGGCREYCDLMVYAARSLGIPVSTDFYRTSPETGGSGHLWNILKDTTGTIVPFWFIEWRAERGNSDGRKKEKSSDIVMEHSPNYIPVSQRKKKCRGI